MAKKKSVDGERSRKARKFTADTLATRLYAANYLADDLLLTALELLLDLGRPLLLEGEAGVGKTEVAAALARALNTRLIRLQCYEGLDVHSALYEWNYQRQLLAIRMLETDKADPQSLEQQIFSETYLLKRPLLQALSEPVAPVLLIDEIDRADQEFEAYLLELLADFQISIPELGTIEALSKPHVILTSNGTRDVSDALRRRCLYCWIDYPDAQRELEILLLKIPEIDTVFAREIAEFVAGLREQELVRKPGIAETLDWAAALLNFGLTELDSQLLRVQRSLICLLKTADDQRAIDIEVLRKLIRQADAGSA